MPTGISQSVNSVPNVPVFDSSKPALLNNSSSADNGTSAIDKTVNNETNFFIIDDVFVQMCDNFLRLPHIYKCDN